MVLLIIIPFLNGYFIGNIPNIFRQTHMAYLEELHSRLPVELHELHADEAPETWS